MIQKKEDLPELRRQAVKEFFELTEQQRVTRYTCGGSFTASNGFTIRVEYSRSWGWELY